MFGNGRKTIGVILCDVSSHYQEQVCQTMSVYARSAGYNLAYFTFYTCYGDDSTRNGRGEANIVHLIPFEKLDAIVFCHDTIVNKTACDFVFENIRQRSTCPVITLRQDSGVFPCVLVNRNHCIEDLVDHFINVHHKTRLAFMSGPKDHPDSVRRLNDYKSALEAHGIPYDESLVFEGDFWTKKAAEAAEYFMEELDERPEAILCANDYMASSLMNELISRGYLIPNDVAVSGFDNIWESSITLPPITTVSVPVQEMVEKGMDLIEKMWRQEKIERIHYVDAGVILRNSCGCETFDMQSMLAKRVRQVTEYDRIVDANQSNTYMFIDLSELEEVDGIEKHLRLGDLCNNHVDSLLICLGEGRGTKYPKYRSASNGFAKRSKVVGGVYHKKSCDFEIFNTDDLIPEEVSDDEPMIYYFFPVHNNQYCYGYAAISFEKTYVADKTFNNWLAILGNTFETIRIKQKNHELLQKLNNLYVHDALTGLYNRRGFDSVSAEYFDMAKDEKTSFLVVALDMDNLKIVNDRFGHMNGDLALKTIGDAMMRVARKTDACARVGGDEYNIVGYDYTVDEVESLIDDFQAYLTKFNAHSELPYLVKASVGYSLIEYGDDTELEECINQADAKLYEFKREKKELKKDNVLR